MRKIILTTESCADLSKEQLERHHLRSVPFSVNFPDRTVFDGEIPIQEIYDFYKETKKIPKTNAISPYQYTEFFETIAEENPGCEIIHMGYSSACSCSFQNATIGVRDCKKARVHLVDSRNVSGGFGNLTLKAAQILEENPEDTAEQLVEKILPYVKKTYTSFVPDSLDFLLAGGRVSNAAAIGATILRLKPRIDIIDGELIAAKKYRGNMKKVYPRFIDDFLEGHKFDPSIIYFFHTEGADMSLVEEAVKYLRGKGFQQVQTGVLGSVMTVHGGKGAIGISATEL